ncbi:YhfG family protein [Acinetobacter sp. ANC 4636]
MLVTTEQKRKYIQATRLKNYQASLKLEGLKSTTTSEDLTKNQILQKYQAVTQTVDS